MAGKLELAEVLKQVSEQLVAAGQAAKARGNAVMQFDECEVEFAVKIAADGKAGIKVWVVEVGGGASYEQSNKIKVKFKSIPGQIIAAAQIQDTAFDSPAPETPLQTKPRRK